MRSRWALCLGLLLSLGCQPYLDHPLEDGFPANLAGRGVKRRLALSSLEASSDSVLLVFNQPLRQLGESVEPPFRPQLLPELPLKDIVLEGAAGLRLTFDTQVRASRPYRIRIPAGWRALTGAVYSQAVERAWTFESSPASVESLAPPAIPGEELRYLGPREIEGYKKTRWPLLFSSKPSLDEVERCLTAFPPETRPRVERDEKGSLFLCFGRRLPDSLRLLAGLTDELGRKMEQTVDFELPPARRALTAPSPPSGRLRLPRYWVGAGEPVVVVGVATSSKAQSRGRLCLSDATGRYLWSASLCWPEGLPFVARVSSPSTPGRYQVTFFPEGGGSSWEGEFWACPTAEHGESYQLSMETSERDALPSKAVLTRKGARHRAVALRAYLRPREEEDFPSSWERRSDPVPGWIPLGESSEEEIPVRLPRDWRGGGTLVVEAVDAMERGLVLARTHHRLEPTSPRLTLSLKEPAKRGGALLASVQNLEKGEVPLSVSAVLAFRQRGENGWVDVGRHEEFSSSPWVLPLYRPGRYRLTVIAELPGERVLREVYEREVVPWSPFSPEAAEDKSRTGLELERWDGVNTTLRAGERSRLSGPPGAAVGWFPSHSGWEEPSVGERKPLGYPLLPPLKLKPEELAGWLLGSQGESVLGTPSVAGSYRYWSVESSTASGDILDREIGESRHWSAVSPAGVRGGDRFRAGPRFTPGPLAGAVGLTASAELSGLLPRGFYSTAGVAKDSEQTLLFDYQAPERETRLSLAWKVGQGGHSQELSTALAIWPTPPIPRQLKNGRVSLGETVQLSARGPWRLVARALGTARSRAEVVASDPGGRYEVRTLEVGGPPLIFEGDKVGLVRIRHRSGAPPVAFGWYALEPERGQTEPWSTRAYLDRLAVDGSDNSVEQWSIQKGMGVVLSVVNPNAGLTGILECPLPAGVEPVALLPWNSRAPEIPWIFEQGVLRCRLDDLPAGESLWKIELEGRVTGDFLWPSARLLSPERQLWALSKSSRLVVEP